MKDSFTAVMLAFIVVGLMLFVPALAYSLINYATVTVDTTPPHVDSQPIAWLSYSDGSGKQSFTLSESQAEPTAIDDDFVRLWTVRITITESNPSSDPQACTITFPDGTTTLTLSLVLNPDLSDPMSDMYVYEWAVDSLDYTKALDQEGTYTFHFEISDNAGNTVEADYYLARLPDFPTGYWVIAGQQVTEDSHIYVNTLTVHVEWHCTSGSQYVDGVTVKVYDQDGNLLDSVALTRTDDTWEGDVTFPSEGTFEVKGYVADTFGRSERTLTIVGELPATPPALTPGGPRGFSLEAAVVAVMSAVVVVGFVAWVRKRGWLGRA